MKGKFTTSWKRSTQPRRQRKYRYNAPLHTRRTFMGVHLSSDLRKKYGVRTIPVRTGDKVRVLRGQYKKKEGKVERVNVKNEKLFITGIEFVKNEGAKLLAPISVSNVMAVELDMGDRKRKTKLTGGNTAEKKAEAPAKKEGVKRETKEESKKE